MITLISLIVMVLGIVIYELRQPKAVEEAIVILSRKRAKKVRLSLDAAQSEAVEALVRDGWRRTGAVSALASTGWKGYPSTGEMVLNAWKTTPGHPVAGPGHPVAGGRP